MTLRKDKKKVIGEHFDDARIRSFLEHETYGDKSLSYHLLEKAYRGMKEENFSTFLQFLLKPAMTSMPPTPSEKHFCRKSVSTATRKIISTH